MELHGQHEHQALLDPLTHLPLVDTYAGLTDLAARVADAWIGVRTLREQLERSRMDTREKAARLDLIAFQLGEIEKAAAKAGEDETLGTARQVLASAERIRDLCEESYAALYESDGAVLASLGGIWKRLGELAMLDPQFASYVESRDGIKAQLEDLAFFLRSYADGVDASPGRLQEVEDRLAMLERLKRKYGADTGHLKRLVPIGRARPRGRAGHDMALDEIGVADEVGDELTGGAFVNFARSADLLDASLVHAIRA